MFVFVHANVGRDGEGSGGAEGFIVVRRGDFYEVGEGYLGGKLDGNFSVGFRVLQFIVVGSVVVSVSITVSITVRVRDLFDEKFLGLVLFVELFPESIRIKRVIVSPVPRIDLNVIGSESIWICVMVIVFVVIIRVHVGGMLHGGGNGIDVEGAVGEVGQCLGHGIATHRWE